MTVNAGALNLTNDGQISTATTGAGAGGSVTIVGGSVALSGGSQIVASTTGAGNAGTVGFNLTGPLTVDGGGTQISTGVNFGAAGVGGDVTITAGSVSLTQQRP